MAALAAVSVAVVVASVVAAALAVAVVVLAAASVVAVVLEVVLALEARASTPFLPCLQTRSRTMRHLVESDLLLSMCAT